MGHPAGRKPSPPKQLSLVDDGSTVWRGRKVSVRERKRNAERAKAWRLANPGRFESKRDEWAEANKDRIREQRREYYQRNKNKINARNKRGYLRRKAAGLVSPHADTLRRKYGLTVDDYNARLSAQGGGCAICRKEQDGGKKLVVDHCHETGVVRGLLCDGCNQAIGRLGDNSRSVQRAVSYLAAFEDSMEEAVA